MVVVLVVEFLMLCWFCTSIYVNHVEKCRFFDEWMFSADVKGVVLGRERPFDAMPSLFENDAVGLIN